MSLISISLGSDSETPIFRMVLYENSLIILIILLIYIKMKNPPGYTF